MKNPSSQAVSYDSALFWFRRDLRVSDNAGLYRALKAAKQVYCVFVFDREILDALPSLRDRRVEFIHQSIAELKQSLIKLGGDLIVRHARTDETLPALARELKVDAVFTNEDYEPMAIARDVRIRESLREHDIEFFTFKDTVIFEKDEVLTQSGGTYSVFTPYKNAWLKKLDDFQLKPYPVAKYAKHLAKPKKKEAMPTLASLGFEPTNLKALGIEGGEAAAAKLRDDFMGRIDDYKEARDYPAVKGVSYLSVHNRFGTISIRELASVAHAETLRRKNIGAETWLSELVWRDFYFQIIYHHPHAATSAFRPEYDAIRWPNDGALFAAWCEARTGYPIIDAAMRQINDTGYMHNRLRMIVASFLTKDLLIDWRYGEKYFADNLNDFDLSANNGGWQWAASTGCDAQPYFRIFNPVTQSERFDPKGKFIRRYLPELKDVPDKFIHAPWTLPPLEQQALGVVIGKNYPAPVVDHAVQREKALAMYKVVKS
ncbi:MAG: deoxyribodipyrimidine photo-lyase [Betaproteobacteria bacterium]|nr:deoxyribodipyrimidine photo-lyase [Betaproteobacteria bacterium]